MIVSLFKYKLAGICIWVCIQTSVLIYVIQGRSRPDEAHEVYHVRQSSKVYVLLLFYTFKRCATKLEHLVVYSYFKNLQHLNIW